MQTFSYHSHTAGIYDGANSVQDMIEQAERAGLTSYGISNHMSVHHNMPDWMPMFFNDYKKAKETYQRTAEEIRKAAAKSSIPVYVGFEVDYFQSPRWYEGFLDIIRDLDYDYLIGSTHFLQAADKETIVALYDRTRPKRPRDDFRFSYYRNIQACIKSGHFNWIGHIDWIKRFDHLDTVDLWYDKLKVARLLSDRKMPTEINTSGWYRFGEPYPSVIYLHELNRLNVPILISDDSHRQEDIGKLFPEAEDLLRKIRYRNRVKEEFFLSPEKRRGIKNVLKEAAGHLFQKQR